jgi:hypothetical protein
VAKRKRSIEEPEFIPVSQGDAPGEVDIDANQPAIFANQDNRSYLIEFWDRDKKARADVTILLGPFATITVYPDPNNRSGKGTLHYEILDGPPSEPKKRKKDGAGGHVIVIGNS